MERELLRLSALIATDGGIYKKRNQIYFDSTDTKLIRTFVTTVKDLGIKKVFVNKGHGTYEAYFYSSVVANKLLTILGDKKTIPISLIWKLSKQEIAEILRILFSTDGGVSFCFSRSERDKKIQFHRKVTFTSKNRKNLHAVHLLLKCFGVDSKIHENELEIKGYKNLVKFQESIKFLEGVKVTKKSKRWSGLEKNKLLKLVIQSYRDTHGE